MNNSVHTILHHIKLSAVKILTLHRLFAVVVSIMLGAGSSVQAREINFDDLDTVTTGSIFVPHLYAGMAWGSAISPVLTALNDSHWTGVGNYNNPGNDSPSGDNLVLNSGIVSVATAINSAFDFNGAYFAPFTSGNDLASQGSTALTLVAEGYNNGAFMASASVNFQQAGFVWLQANFTGITELRITGLNPAILPYQTRWAMDNFSVTDTIPSVPAPPALWLFITGLAVLGLNRINKLRLPFLG